HFPGADVKWNLPAGAHVRESRARPEGGLWVIDIAPDYDRLTLSGEARGALPLSEFPCPLVTARNLGPEPGQVRHWIAILGNDLRAGPTTGVQPVAADSLASVFNEKQKAILEHATFLGFLEPSSDEFRLHAAGNAAPNAVAQVPAEFSAAAMADGDWLLQARYWISADDRDWKI